MSVSLSLSLLQIIFFLLVANAQNFCLAVSKPQVSNIPQPVIRDKEKRNREKERCSKKEKRIRKTERMMS